jgi:hypothetical protein
MSKREPYGNVKMKGQLYRLLSCGCCVARNGKKLKLTDYIKEYVEETRKLSSKETRILFQEDVYYDNQ